MLKSKKEISRLALLFSITYMVSYITRINFGTIIAEMETSTGISKSLLSISLTGSFVTYGAGQIVSGICGDKFSAKKLLSLGLFVTTLMNLLIPICINYIQIFLVWSINGFAQAFMWPPIVKILASLLTVDDYKKTIVKISWGSSVGTIILYLISPLIISLFSWKAVFIFSAICGACMLFFWNKFAFDAGSVISRSEPVPNNKIKKLYLFNPIMIGVMVAIVLQGMLKDGVTTWMPSYIAETYNMSNVISILTGVLLPIFSIICFQASSVLYGKMFNNPTTCAGAFFCIGSLGALFLILSSGKNAPASIFCSALLTGSMHGVNLMYISMVPHFFSKYGKVSTVSGVLNACTYLGSAISTYIIAFFVEKFGWGFNLISYLVIAVSGMIISALLIKPWKKHYM